MREHMGRVFLTFLVLACSSLGQEAAKPVATTAPRADTTKPSKTPTAKNAPDVSAGKTVRSPWLERATYLTAQLEEDSARMKDFRDALLKARIGQAWWPADEKRALQYLNTAAEAVQTGGQNESDDSAARFQILQQLVLITTQLTPERPAKKEIHAKLQKALLSAAENLADSPQLKNSPKLRLAVSNAVSRIARVAESDGHIDDAVPAIRTLIRLHMDPMLFHMIIDLYQKDQKRGEDLFIQAVDEGRASGNSTSAANAAYAAFEDVPYPVRPSERMQQAAGEFYVDTLLRALGGEEQKKEVCHLSAMASLVTPKLPPALAGQVNTGVQACAGALDKDWAMQKEMLDAHFETAEDYLKAASAEPDLTKRVQLKRQAIYKAMNAQQDQRAIEILRGFTDDEKKEAGDLFSEWSMSITIIEKLYRAHDMRGIDNLLDEIPDEYRGPILIQYAQMLGQGSDTATQLSVLRRARKELEEHRPGMDDSYPLLFVTYSKVAPSEKLSLLKFVVKGLNQYSDKEREEAIKSPRPYYFRLSDSFEPMPNTGMALLDFDEGTGDAALKELDSPDYRTVFRLGLLMAALRRQAAEQAAAAPPVKTTAQKPN